MVKAFNELQIRRFGGAFRRGLRMLILLLFFTSCSDFKLWRKRDKDFDGVTDKKDRCPDTPRDMAVDPNGCPLDSDGDGVPDYQDRCPTEKGQATLEGCYDRDNDGVRDADDKCPDVPGKPEHNGCADADSDGIIDQNDKCPDTPAGEQVDGNGCPLVLDMDSDGTTDQKDKCPDTPAGTQVDGNGCPIDGDRDGVPDDQDSCPDRAGLAFNKGCPEGKTITKKILQKTTKYIYFEVNKAIPPPKSLPIIESIAAFMAESPEYSVSIAAHTDNLEGSGDQGLKLAQERATLTRTYLLSQGVPSARIETRIYGATKPIADNTTADGQALNRRVDIDLYPTGAPNAAESKYGPALYVRASTSGQSNRCFEEGSAVYNTPRKMEKGKLYNVVLSLVAGVVDGLQSPQRGTSSERRLPSTKITSHHLVVNSYLGVPVVPDERNIILEQIKITPFMSVDLRSDSSYFLVTPEEPQVFVNVKNDTIQQRVWRVKPIKSGERLPLNFIIKGSCDDSSLKNSRPFYKTIEVNVIESPKPVSDQITDFMEWLKKNLLTLAAILAALSGIYAWFKRGRTGEIQPDK
ncbi:OmpA family protein [Hymenobacter cellulosivorans]|uniref:OmpA family protein n=1 Tax=Hymenobacter cellulosivorans TaxID=2932249 RepID=A0ABY4FB91_9BACT|nr:OmpA family protein [Hymenobacter cellulosivorans]UOQ51716.1 OmpA family protein [Hymenobacter cellulosivorans]